MKKEYMKPYLAVESFQLDAAIAGSCSGKVVLGHSLETCTLDDDKGINYGDPFLGLACGKDGIDILEKDACYQAMASAMGYLES